VVMSTFRHVEIKKLHAADMCCERIVGLLYEARLYTLGGVCNQEKVTQNIGFVPTLGLLMVRDMSRVLKYNSRHNWAVVC
jgi:hypothetical protein